MHAYEPIRGQPNEKYPLNLTISTLSLRKRIHVSRVACHTRTHKFVAVKIKLLLIFLALLVLICANCKQTPLSTFTYKSLPPYLTQARTWILDYIINSHDHTEKERERETQPNEKKGEPHFFEVISIS